MSSEHVSWDEIESMVSVLTKKILNSSRVFSSISTVSRGGLVPSRLLADSLSIDKIFVDQKQISADSLFVDDIYDSGITFDNVLLQVDNPSKLFFVTLYARKGKTYPSQLIYGKQTKDDSYVVFPWDKSEYQRTQK